MRGQINRRAVLKTLGTSAAMAALAGCSEGGESGNSGTGRADNSSSGDDGTDTNELEGDVVVTLTNTAFDPMVVEIDTGETVSWVNEDETGHDVTATQFNDIATEWSFEQELAAGAAASHTFEDAGVYEYSCTIHGETEMCGVVTVGESEQIRPLPCMNGDQVTERVADGTLDLLSDDTPYGVDTMTTGPDGRTGNIYVREGSGNRRKISFEWDGQIGQEIYYEGGQAYAVQDGTCLALETDDPIEDDSSPVNAFGGQGSFFGPSGEGSNYERLEEYKDAFELKERTTVDGAPVMVFDIDLEEYEEASGEELDSSYELLESTVTIRTDTWHLIRQSARYTTDDGAVEAEIRYHSFEDPFDITIPSCGSSP